VRGASALLGTCQGLGSGAKGARIVVQYFVDVGDIPVGQMQSCNAIGEFAQALTSVATMQNADLSGHSLLSGYIYTSDTMGMVQYTP
jgi:hypothetical protein